MRPPRPENNRNDNYPININQGNNNYQSIQDESQNSGNKNFNDDIRKGFIKKVYSILTLQMLIVVAACVLTMLDKKIASFQRKNKEYFYIAMVLSIILLLVLTCFTKIARKVPLNYFLLLIFTGCEAYMVSYACAVTKPKVVLMAASMTAGMVLLLTLYACVTDSDYTTFGAYLFAAAMAMLLMGIFYMFTKNKLVYIILCGLGVLLCSIYIIYDTQLILGNKTNSLSPEDFILAPLILFVDIVGLFLNMLGIISYVSE
jgi:FtsH-binding integral membrane protein